MDIYSQKKRTQIMSRVRNKDSKIEVIFRKTLWKQKIRYRKNGSKYFGKPDIILRKYKTVIFIDSCFWHCCTEHGTMPKTKRNFWKKKFARNVERDKEVSQHYRKIGWKIFRIWEHQLKDHEKIISKIVAKLPT